MTISSVLRRTALGLAGVMLVTVGCGLAFNHSDVLVLTKVNVPTGNGTAEVIFAGLAGQTVTISLTGRSTSMVPVGNLVGPDASQVTVPTASSSSDGFNTDTASLTHTGTYRLEVSDEAGIGGQVTVRVQLAN